MPSHVRHIVSALYTVLICVTALAGSAQAQNGADTTVAIDFTVSTVVGRDNLSWRNALRLSGPITDQSVKAVAKAIDAMKAITNDTYTITNNKTFSMIVELDSPGGSVNAAMSIGRLLRANDAMATINNGASCVSACVLILAAATERTVYGTVGIHRPYFESAKTAPSISEVASAVKALKSQISGYLEEMNVHAALADEMMSTPPERVRYLNDSELSRYRLVGSDPVKAETTALREASKYGLSRAEYERRRARIDVACKKEADLAANDWSRNLNAMTDCWEDVLRGKR